MKTVILFLICVFSINVWAHGEEKPGPNGGHIQMPGPFHTELEIDPAQDAHIFLLDLNFQNPSVKDSSVQAVFKSGKTSIDYSCSIMGGNHFHCKPQKKLPAQGELVIKAIREKAVGNEVVYQVPLKPFETASQKPAMDHSQH